MTSPTTTAPAVSGRRWVLNTTSIGDLNSGWRVAEQAQVRPATGRYIHAATERTATLLFSRRLVVAAVPVRSHMSSPPRSPLYRPADPRAAPRHQAGRVGHVPRRAKVLQKQEGTGRVVFIWMPQTGWRWTAETGLHQACSMQLNDGCSIAPTARTGAGGRQLGWEHSNPEKRALEVEVYARQPRGAGVSLRLRRAARRPCDERGRAGDRPDANTGRAHGKRSDAIRR